MRRLVVAVLSVALFLPTGPALAYEDSGFDPDDRPVVGFDPDIRSTVRTVWTREGVGRRLGVRFRAYEPLGLYWFVTAFLDSRRGPRPDYVMKLFNEDLSGRGCYIYPHGHPHQQSVQGVFRQEGDAARCRVPASLLHPTKRIRWKLRSPSGYLRTTEFAPNGGAWYG